MTLEHLQMLLIEDNPADAKFIREMLAEVKEIDIDLDWVSRLSTGLNRYAGDGVDVVLLDLALPDSQGLDPLRTVQSKLPHAPVVVLTGLDDGAQALAALREGAQDYLVKCHLDGTSLIRSVRYAVERKRIEEELELRNTVLSTLGESCPDGILVVNERHRIIHFSRRFMDIWKIPLEVLEAGSEERVQHMICSSLADPGGFRARLALLYEDRHAVGNEELVLKDGRTLEFHSAPIFGSGERYCGQIWFFHDITDGKRPEEKLLFSEVKYRRLFEAAKEGVMLLHAETGMVVDVNPFLADLLGIPQEGIRGKTIWELGCFKDIAASKAHFLELQQKGYVRYEDLPLETANGRRVEVEFVSNVYEVDHQKLIQCNIRDITERKRREEELAFKNALLKAQSETFIDGILAVDGKGQAISWNQRFAEMWNIPLELLATRSEEKMLAYVLSLLEAPEELLVKLKYLYSHPTKKSKDELTLRDGRAFDQYSSPLLCESGASPGRIWFFRDVTELKQAIDHLTESAARLTAMLEGTVQAIASAIELRDPYTAGHEQRVAQLASAIATEMKLPDKQTEGIRVASYVHDIGKIAVPAEILSKPGEISDHELGIIGSHPQHAYDILKQIEFVWPVALAALQHHERLDGSGYPQGLKNGQIILEARILAVADVVEAMSSHRPYRPALGIEQALEEIAGKKTVLYDPQVVDVCVALFREKNFSFKSVAASGRSR